MMNRRKFLGAAGLGLTVLSDALGRAAVGGPRLTILQTNDTHSRIDPFPMDGGRHQGLGGVARRKVLIDRIRGREEHTLLVDSGDLFQGTPYYNLYGGEVEVEACNRMGYEVVKMKIGGAPLDEDLARIETVLEVVGEGKYLAVDANGRFDLETAIAYAEAMEPYKLFWYEEAGDPLDYALQAELAKHYSGPMATGENLFSHQDARNLLRHGGMRADRDWLQFDCALSYGLVEYLRTLNLLGDHGFSTRNICPHGGHQLSLNIAAGLKLGGNESYPEVFAPFGGFADDTKVENGRVPLPDAPGIGFEKKSALIKCLREATET